MSSLKFQKELTTKRKYPLMLALITATLVVAVFCLIFVRQIRNTTYTESERYLSELSDSLANSVNAQITENLKELQSISMTYAVTKGNGTMSREYLQEKADLMDFTRVSIVSPDGKSFGSDSFEFDFSSYSAIMHVFEGESVICNGIDEYAGTRNCFIYAVPIYENGRITSVMAACNTPEWLEHFINQRYFVGEAFFHVFESNGSFLTRSENQNTVLEGDNIFVALENAKIESGITVDNIRSDVKAGRSGCIYFTMPSGERRIMFYRPLDDYKGFYIAMNIVRKAATQKFDKLLFEAIAINVFITLMFIALIIAIFIFYKRINGQLSTIAFVDPITGGKNQACFELEAEKIIRKASPNEYSLITINIAKFKLINDSFGTEAGNKVLKYIHGIIAKHIEKGELICRTSSDNFDILVKYTSDSNIIDTLHTITEDINKFNNNSKYKYYISLTAGVYTIREPALPIISIRDRANVARKNTRTASGNHLFSCVFYSDMERHRQLREKEMENKMEAALANGDFVVYLQPKVATDNRRISGAEALVRWMDKDNGIVPPNDFVPFFERNGFIVKLDLYVFEQVCKAIRKWIDNDLQPVPVSVNLSRRHLTNPNFIDQYQEVQKKYDIPPGLIEIELTETLVFENLEQIIRTVTKIHDSGFTCSLDDFGSGYSSLNMLKDIKVDALKLDRDFFSSPNSDNPRERAIIQSVVDMAKKLNMTTISEGVETMYQLDFLESIDCDLAQGFVISKPVPIELFETLTFGRPIEQQNTDNQ